LKNKFNIKILYVEDEESIREEITYFLSRLTDDLYIAINGQEGLDLYKTNNPDLVITDISMPVLDGIEMSKAIKAFDSNSKIIMLTAFNDSDYLLKAINIGIDGYLVKPINLSLLLEKIKSIYYVIGLEKENKRVNSLFEQYKKAVDLNAIVSKTDSQGNITYINEEFENISGYEKDELIGQSHSIIKHEDMPETVFKDLWKTIKGEKKPWFGKIKNKRKDGSSYYVDTVINPIFNANGDIIEYIAIRNDITSIMNPKNQLMDDLNSMDNPTLILAKISNYSIFKEFYTEEVRNKFDKYISKVLLDYFPPDFITNKVYILGNGLFGFINKDKFNKDHKELYLTKVLKELKDNDIIFEGNKYEIDILFSFSDDKKSIYDDASIGISKLQKSKDHIMYSTGLYNESQIAASKKLQTLALIKDALKKEDKVVSYYQPIIDNKTKSIVKYESLIRIIMEDEKVLLPYEFIDIAKKTGYYHELTKKVIENAHSILSKSDDIEVSINISYSDIDDIKVRDALFNLVSEHANKGRVTFELLEDENIKNIDEIKAFIQLVKIVGDVKISIDDFGSGYSNYGRLSIFQPDFIKIDGSLIKNIVVDRYSQSVVKSIVLFAKENSIKTIAEFVSDEDIHKKIKELGIDYSQGYLFGKPEPLDL